MATKDVIRLSMLIPEFDFSDDCRFPHVMPDGPGPYFTARGGGPRQPRGHSQSNNNGSSGLEENFNNMNIRDVRDLP
jgi:hypothetical protein